MCSVTELQFKVPLLHFGGGANDLKEMQSQSEKAFYDRREVMKRILNGRKIGGLCNGLDRWQCRHEAHETI